MGSVKKSFGFRLRIVSRKERLRIDSVKRLLRSSVDVMIQPAQMTARARLGASVCLMLWDACAHVTETRLG